MKRVVATGIMLALAVAAPRCTSDKTNPITKKTPAVETIANAGPKPRVQMADKDKKLAFVPKKVEKDAAPKAETHDADTSPQLEPAELELLRGLKGHKIPPGTAFDYDLPPSPKDKQGEKKKQPR